MINGTTMRRIALLISTCFFFAGLSFGQLTGTKNIPGDYASLDAAIADLNSVGVGAGGVVFNVLAGNPQTAPAGGYIIGNTGSAILSGVGVTGSTKTVTLQGNGNTITAFSPQVAGNGNDAIIKLVGADWITITGFSIQENSGNTVLAPAASNTMTEWAIGLFYVTTTDGAQNNTIQENTISMNRLYRNSFAVYSSVRHTMPVIDIAADITSAAGSNSGNKVYGNTITDVNYPVFFNGSATPDYYDTGNDIGGSSSATGNSISNWGYMNGQQFFVDMDLIPGSHGIIMFNQLDERVAWNSIVSAAVSNDNGISGILKDHPVNNGVPAGTHTSVYDHNTITVSQGSGAAGATLAGIQTHSLAALSSITLSITDNTIVNCSMTGAGSDATGALIATGMACGTLTITGNIIKGNFTCVLNAGSFYGIYNFGAVTSTININNNQLGVTGSGLVSSTAVLGIDTLSAISNTASGPAATININNNSIDGISCFSSAAPLLIFNNAPTANKVNIKNNQLGTVTGTSISFSAVSGDPFYGIFNNGSLYGCVIDISGNDIRGVVHIVPGGDQHFIRNGVARASQNISSNTFTNLVSNTGGSVYFIGQAGDMVSGSGFTCNSNAIVGTYSKPIAGGVVYFLQSTGNSESGSLISETGNNFSNVTLPGATQLIGWDEEQGISDFIGPTKTISSNTFSNITVGAAAAVIYVKNGAGTACSGNTISNISATNVNGILAEPAMTAGTFTISNNTISGLAGTTEVTGIGGGSTATSITITNNSISTISSSAPTTGNACAINIGAATLSISRNTISGISSIGSAAISTGISIKGGGTISTFRNKISGITNTYAGTSTIPLVHGLLLLGGTTVTANNNFIADLTAPSLSGPDVIRGISILSTTPATSYNLYYNSVYLIASSSGAEFGTSAVFDSTSATATTAALKMIDNIFVNTSTPAGTGTTTVFRRSDATLDNYSLASDYNLFYAGTPGPSRLIFSDGTNADQTLAGYQARVSTRDANSITEMPVFASPTDLHLLSNVNCKIDRRGIPISGFTNDIDGFSRDATTPDIGADEFTTVPSTTLAGLTGTTVCDSRIINPSGSDFTNNSCDLILRVVPAGASPVSGYVNACVYIDPTVLPTYNAEPYVQRHFDIEPATSAATATGRVTLYFTDAEFVTYNANNASWPDLPTLAGGGSTDPNIANMRISQYHGTPMTSPSSPNQYSAGTAEYINPDDFNVQWNGSYWGVTFNVTTGFSGFYVHTNLRWVLPVEVNYFHGSRQGSGHVLNWKLTCNSTPTVTITLERSSISSGGFVTIYSINATAARCNLPFDYTDAQPLPGMNYYRVKMTDANGKITYSSIVALLNASKGFDIVSVAPNPVVNGTLTLNATSAQVITINFVIIDMQGRVVKRERISLAAGFSSTGINVSDLSSGTYSLYGTTAEGRSSVLRFVKQ